MIMRAHGTYVRADLDRDRTKVPSVRPTVMETPRLLETPDNTVNSKDDMDVRHHWFDVSFVLADPC
jgi:hypothetical protein